uniref:Uncharacterized protein n=1 Tax=Gasterosteus aculeatus TaxID=69293 RepID=G3NQB9_GASAC
EEHDERIIYFLYNSCSDTFALTANRTRVCECCCLPKPERRGVAACASRGTACRSHKVATKGPMCEWLRRRCTDGRISQKSYVLPKKLQNIL